MSENTVAMPQEKLSSVDRWRYYITFFAFALLWMGGLALVASVLLPSI